MLRHTTEEVLAVCIEAIEPDRAAFTSHLRNQVVNDLVEGLKKHSWFTGFDIADELPMRHSINEWIKLAKENQATVFIAGSVSGSALYLFFFLKLLWGWGWGGFLYYDDCSTGIVNSPSPLILPIPGEGSSGS